MSDMYLTASTLSEALVTGWGGPGGGGICDGGGGGGGGGGRCAGGGGGGGPGIGGGGMEGDDMPLPNDGRIDDIESGSGMIDGRSGMLLPGTDGAMEWPRSAEYITSPATPEIQQFQIVKHFDLHTERRSTRSSATQTWGVPNVIKCR